MVSSYALERMRNHDAAEVDYTLLEWILAVAINKHHGGVGRAVFPLILGDCSDPILGCRSKLDTRDFNNFPGNTSCNTFIHPCAPTFTSNYAY